MEAQLQIRQNAQEVQTYMKDLFDWEKSIKQREGGKRRPKQPAGSTPGQQPEPPIRGRASGNIAAAPQELQHPAVQPGAPAPARRASRSAAAADASSQQDAAAHTYKNYDKWDKYDVDAAVASDDDDVAADAPARSSRTQQGCSAPPAVPAPRSAPGSRAAQPSASASNQAAQASTPSADPPSSSSGRSSPAAPPTPAQTSATRGQSPEPSTPEEWRARGNSLFQAGQYESALDCYCRSIAAGPSCLGHANRAMALLKLNRPAEAEQDASAAIALDASYVKAYQRRGAARRSMQQWLGAASDFEEALRLEPGSKALQADRDECLQRHMDAHGLAALTGQEVVEVEWPAVATPAAAEPAPAAAPAATTRASGPSQEAASLNHQQEAAVAARASGAATSAAVAALEAAATATKQQPATTTPDSAAAPAGQQAASTSTQANQQQQQEQQRPPIHIVAAAAAQQAAAKRLQQAFKQPRTSTEFESAWRSLQQDPGLQASYLAQLPAEQLPAIFKSSLTAQALCSIARVALVAVASGSSNGSSNGSIISGGRGGGTSVPALEPAHAAALLAQLPKVPRFDMAAMCIVSKDKAELRALWDAAVAAQGQSALAAGLADVRRLYKL